MKTIIPLIALCISGILVKAQAHDPKFNFDYITYANSSPRYNPNVPSDNAHFKGYFNIDRNCFVFFPDGNCLDAYPVEFMAYVDVDHKRKMMAKYDKDKKQFFIWPANPQDGLGDTDGKYVDAFDYRKTKDGGVGTLSIH